MTPDYRITIDGVQDVTPAIRGRLLSLTVVDEAGQQSDTIEIGLDNRGGRIALPRHGAEIRASLGYAATGLVSMGRYTVDEVEVSGPPDTLVVRGKGADMLAGLKSRKTRSWDDVSLGELVAEIASEHDLPSRVGSSLRGVRIPHLDQTEESDLHLLTRLGREYDAIATPAGGELLFVARGAAVSASGRPMPSVVVQRQDAGDYRVTLSERSQYRAVQAHWIDTDGGGQEVETAGQGEPVYIMRHVHASAGEARSAAVSKLQALTRGTGSLSISLRPGNPSVAAEASLNLKEFGRGIDGLWVATRVTHTLAGGGYSTRATAGPPTTG